MYVNIHERGFASDDWLSVQPLLLGISFRDSVSLNGGAFMGVFLHFALPLRDILAFSCRYLCLCHTYYVLACRLMRAWFHKVCEHDNS